MSLRRSRRLAGLSPEVVNDMSVCRVNVQKDISIVSFFGTMVSIVIFSGALVFALWN
jgi:hypothetical protein